MAVEGLLSLVQELRRQAVLALPLGVNLIVNCEPCCCLAPSKTPIVL